MKVLTTFVVMSVLLCFACSMVQNGEADFSLQASPNRAIAPNRAADDVFPPR